MIYIFVKFISLSRETCFFNDCIKVSLSNKCIGNKTKHWDNSGIISIVNDDDNFNDDNFILLYYIYIFYILHNTFYILHNSFFIFYIIFL